ncbi:36064_t:CDS:1, partial [Racocetra persica]
DRLLNLHLSRFHNLSNKMSTNNNALSIIFVDPSRPISRQRLIEEIQALKDKVSSLEVKVSSLEIELSSFRQFQAELPSLLQLISQLT